MIVYNDLERRGCAHHASAVSAFRIMVQGRNQWLKASSPPNPPNPGILGKIKRKFKLWTDKLWVWLIISHNLVTHLGFFKIHLNISFPGKQAFANKLKVFACMLKKSLNKKTHKTNPQFFDSVWETVWPTQTSGVNLIY